jgi:hypothetical protein
MKNNLGIILCFVVLVAIIIIISTRMHEQTNQIDAHDKVIGRLIEITDQQKAIMDSNMVIIDDVQTMIDSFLVADQEHEEKQSSRIRRSMRMIQELPTLSDDEIHDYYQDSYDYLLDEYRKGKLQPSE